MIEPVKACKQFPLVGTGSHYILLLLFVQGINLALQTANVVTQGPTLRLSTFGLGG